jgi:trigger factor
MSITVEKTASQTSIIKVQLKKEDYEKKVNDTVKKLSKQVALKGFRPGMAPLGLVKKMYGGNVIVEEVNKLFERKNNRIHSGKQSRCFGSANAIKRSTIPGFRYQ